MLGFWTVETIKCKPSKIILDTLNETNFAEPEEKNYIQIARGSARIVYLRTRDNKIFKVPRKGREIGLIQSQEEARLFALIPEEYHCFFPNPVFKKKGIIEMDYIDSLYELYPFSDFEYNFMKWNTAEFALEQGLINKDVYNKYINLEKILSELGCYVMDINESFDNVGVKDGQFYILDWGWTKKAESLYENIYKESYLIPE